MYIDLPHYNTPSINPKDRGRKPLGMINFMFDTNIRGGIKKFVH